MKKINLISISALLILLMFSLCACGGTGVAEPTPEPTAEPLAFSDDPNAITEASANIVMLTTYDKSGEIYKTGSGFPAFEDGYIVTNYHVIEGADRIEGNTESEMYFKIDEITSADKERDIAILKTNAKTGLTPLTLGDTSALQKGEKVVAIGSPLGLINTVSDGMYSNRRTEDGQEYLQFTAAISPGSSGGALFNDKGEVIGITSASYTEGQNLNLAIPSEVVLDVWNNKEIYSIENAEEDYYSVEDFLMLSSEHDGETIRVGGFISSSFHRYSYSAHGTYEDYYSSVYLVDNEDNVYGNTGSYGWNESLSYPVCKKEIIRCNDKGSAEVEIWTITAKELEQYVPGEFAVFEGIISCGWNNTNSLHVIEQ